MPFPPHTRWSVGPALALVLSTAAAEPIRTEYQILEVEPVVLGLSNPWSLAFLPDGRMLISERAGRLLLADANGELVVVDGAPEVAAAGQGGLLDIALHPDFARNGWVYLSYSKAEPGNTGLTATALARGRLDGTRLKDLTELFVQDRYSSPGRHYGSRLAWLPDGTLLMSVGDRGAEPPRAQDLGDHAGSLLRLTEDGLAAPDNPFLDRPDARPEIYSYGHRNIQGLLVDPRSGTIWATEHGPRGGDELNRIEAGANFGWPVVSLGRDYRTQTRYFDYTERSRPGMIDPMIDWTPPLNPSGLALLPDETVFAAQWSGNLLAGGLRTEQIRRLVFEDGIVVHEEELIRGRVGRIRDVRIGPDGLVYVVTDNGSDGVYRIRPVE